MEPPVRPNPRPRLALLASSRRIAIHVAVIGVHLVAWLVCFHGNARSWRPAASPHAQPSARLTIRLLTATTASAPRAPPRLQLQARRMRDRHPRNVPTPPTDAPPPATALPSRAHAVGEAAAGTPDYVPGGNLLRGGMSTPPPVRLPGSSNPIVVGFHMTDPRLQGIGGAVRKLQMILGVPDPHCIDVEVWRGMTMAEQLARHISADDVERTAERYHCGPG